MVRYMFADSGFSSSMWGELFMAAEYLKNRTPHKALKMDTPFKMFHGEEADVSHLGTIKARHQGLQKARRHGLGRESVRL